jgi:small subunit ribosomal protein S16
MAVKLRLARHGAKKRPYYRLVAADQRFARDGRFLEHIGSYDPNHNPPAITLKRDRIQYWLDQGAQTSPTVGQLLAKHMESEDVSPGRKAIPVDPPAPEPEPVPVPAAKAAPAEKPAEAVEAAAEEAPAEEAAEAAPEEPAEAAAEEAPAEEEAVEAAAEEPAEEAAEAAAEEPAKEAASDEEKGE